MTDLFRQFIRYNITKRIILIFFFAAIIFSAIWVRAFIGSIKEFREGKEYFNDRQYMKAITFFDRSMHWYAPFNPYIERSAEYLYNISEKAYQINDDQLALIALETIRNSFYSSRNLYSPGSNWIKRCDHETLNIARDQNENRFKTVDKNAGKDEIYRQDIVYNDPAIFWTIVLEIGLFGWIGAVIGLIFFCLETPLKADKFIHAYWFWILSVGVSYGLWVLGMIKI